MKRVSNVTILIGLTIFAQLVLAQSYSPFISPGKQITISYEHIPPLPQADGMVHYYFNGDTTINNVVYQILYSKVLEGNKAYYCLSNCRAALLREDTAAQKVYKYPGLEFDDTTHFGKDEYLLWDFSVVAGDTVRFVEYNSLYTTTIDSVSNFTLLNGETVRKYWFDYFGYAQVAYTENIWDGRSSFADLKNSYATLATVKVCVFGGGGVVLFSGGNCKTKNYIGIEENDKIVFTFNNPVKDIWKVTTQQNGVVTVFSLNGEIVLSKNIVVGEHFIPVGFLKKGLYIFTFKTEQDFTRGKLIVF